MKFSVDRDVLADAVAWAARSLPVRPSAPVLAGLLIDASDDGLVLSTFDYETSARATLSADVRDEGRALVSGRLLADICRSLPAKPVEMVLDGTRVSLTCGAARFSLQTMPVEDYPTLPQMPAATGTVNSEQFAHAVAQAVTAAGRDDMLLNLSGAHGPYFTRNLLILTDSSGRTTVRASKTRWRCRLKTIRRTAADSPGAAPGGVTTGVFFLRGIRTPWQ